MKLKTLTFLFCFLLFFSGAYSQMTGGGQGEKKVISKSSGPANGWSTVHIGLAQPIGKFKENNLNVGFSEAVGAKPGFYFGADGASYGAANANPFKIGFSWTTGMWINGVNWEKWVAGTTSFEGTPFLTLDVKLGIVGSYEISNGLFIDGFFRAGINGGISGTGSWSGSGSEELSSDTFAIGFGTNFGTSLRYNRLFTSFQINPGKLKYEYYGAIDGEGKLPISTLRLTIGVIMKK
jgi:hypothetical protein